MEMCQREGAQLQKGMNFQMGGNHSVILMSVQNNAPYQDRIEDNGETLIYEGHNISKAYSKLPQLEDQPEFLPSGRPTENGKFAAAARAHTNNNEAPDRVRVYEKIKKGIWSYNGVFHLVDTWQEADEHRQVFKFKLIAVEGDEDFSKPVKTDIAHRRIIPTPVKLEVWKRDGGKCTQCGATDELHFDHVLPYAKGGTSMTAENVQLLCARHNLQKSDKLI